MSDPIQPEVMSAQNTPLKEPGAINPPIEVGPTNSPPMQNPPPADPNTGRFNPPADPANQPMPRRVPLVQFTVFLFSSTFAVAQQFAACALNEQQPWTWIENADMLKAFYGINVFMFSDALMHPDAPAIEQAFVARGARVVMHPDLIASMPPPGEVVSAPSGTEGGPIAQAASDYVNPMDIPPTA